MKNPITVRVRREEIGGGFAGIEPKVRAGAIDGLNAVGLAMLNSAKGILPGDNSPRAMEARRIKGFEDLNGFVFVARIDVEEDAKGGHKNTIKNAIEPGHKDYAAIMGTVTMPSPAAQPSSNGKPPWATGNIPVDAMF